MNIQCTAAVNHVKETNQEDIFYIIGSKYLHICYFYLTTTLVNQYATAVNFITNKTKQLKN